MRLINKIRLRLIIYKTVKVLCKVILQVKIINFQKSVSYKNEMIVCFIVHAEDHMNESVKKTQMFIRANKSKGFISAEIEGEFIICLVSLLNIKGKYKF